MNIFTFFIVFLIFYTIFYFIIKRTDFHNKLFNKSRKHKYIKTILIFILVFFTFSLEYGKQLLNERYGKPNFMSIMIGAFLSSIYFYFIPIAFRRNKQ